MSSARTRTRAPRRSSAEIRRLLLESARTLFAEQGYQATTTQQIVERARVDAPTLYRHFASKAELFEEVALGSLKEFLDEQFQYWRTQQSSSGDLESLVRRFVGDFLSALEAHRDSFRLLVTSSEEEGVLGDLARQIRREFRDGLSVVRQALLERCAAQGYQRQGGSPDVILAAVTGMMLSITLFGDWVFPPEERPSREAQVNEIAGLLLYGITHRPAAPPAGDRGV